MNTALHPARRAPRPQPLALALAACSLLTLALAAPQARAQALPGGLNVVHGQAQVNTAGKTMTVTNSNGAILNWQSFNIAAGQTVRFQQPGASSQVLNRVVGKDASSIFGNLSSNGKVWLLNPNGVLFGRSARIDVAGLVVSTLNLADNDFLANRYSLATALADMPGADIVNQGELRTTLGGRVALLGGNVRNEGLIDAPGGQVLLAAGRSIDLVDTGVPNLTVRVSAPAGEALNMGSLAAAGGRVDLQAAIVNQQGLVRADALALGAGGEVVLRGSQAVNLAAGSVTSAAGGSAGGRVTADAGGGTTLVAGTVDVSAAHGVGGDVRLLGRQVGLVQAGRVEASGATGGGEVLMGGGQQGLDASVPNAEATYFSPDASIHADATERGNGGRVILWSNQATRAYGELSAMGGASGGDGGFIETSGGWLDAAPRAVNTRSRAGGQHGEWLLDPNNILIQDSIAGGNYTGDPLFTSTGDDAQIDSQVIIDALNAGNNVTVTTTSSGANTQAGDITVSNANIFPFANVPTSLSLLADRDIIVENSNIGSSSGQPLSVSLTAARNGGVGRIAISGSSIDTSGGNLTLGGNASAGTGTPAGFVGGAVGYDSTPSATYSAGVTVLDSTLNAGAGTLRIVGGNLAQTATAADGVTISNSALSARDILIDGYTTAPVGLAEAGVHFTDGSDVLATHALTVNGSSSNASGILVDQSSQLQVQPSAPDSTASFTLTGSSAGSDAGVLVEGGGESSTLLALGSGASMTISGSSAGGPGVRLEGAGDGMLIDGELGSNVSLVSTGGGLEFDGTGVLAPDGGSFTASSVGAFSMVDTDVSGVPASASFSAVGTLSLDNSTLSFADSATAVTLSAQTPSAGLGTLTLTDAGVSTIGKIDVRTDSLNLLGQSTLSAGAAGDAIVIAGTSANPNVQAMVNEGGDGALLVNTGARWLVYLTDPASGALAPALTYDFKQYASSFDDAVFSGGNIVTAGTGSGLMYAITPTVTITGSATKTYDASTTAFLNTGPSFSGLVAPNDQGFLDSGAVLDFNDANAGTGKPIAIGGTNPLSFTDGAGNPVYGYAVNNQLSGTITPAPLTINTVNVASRTYDGSTIAGVSTGSVSGYVGSQTLAISASGNFDTKDAGTAKLVTLAPFGLADGTNGGLASNYVLSAAPASASGDITPRPYTLSGAVGDTRNYDGTTLATVSFTTVTGMVGSETLGITGVGDFDTKDVGTGKPISIGSLQLVNGSNGGVVSNYVLSSSFPTSAAGDITPRPVNFASVTAASRAYDGTTLASVTLGAATGLVGDETLILGASGSFDTKDAGTGKTVTVGYSLADGSNGGLASNYSVASAPATTTADITPKTVFAGAAFALNKAYDGSTAATVSAGPLSGLVGGETLVVNASGNFATKDVGNDQVVAVAYGLADGGNGGLASNYSLGNPTSSALADIVPKELRIDAVSAANKVYDGNTVASVSAGPLIGLVGSESLGVSASGSFDTKDAGSGKTVAVSGYGLADGANGGLSSNYTLLSAPTSTTADITPKPLSFSAVTAASKVYDGNQQAEVTLGAPVGLVGSETLDFSASGSFDSKDAGTGKTVVLGYSAADGSNGGLASNYSLAAAPASTTADITPKTLVLSTIGVADKVYDGNTTASVTLGAAIGLVGSETVGLSADGSFSDKNVGSDKAVVLSYGVADGSNGGLAGNYLLSAPAGSNADITPALLTYVANAATSVAGAALPPLSGSVTGFVAQETLASATTGQAAWTAQVEGPTQVGSYAVLGAGLAAQNYVFTQAEGNSTALTVTAIPPLTSSPVAAPTETALGNSLAALTLPATATTPAQGRVLDVLPAMQRDAQAQSYSFQSLPVASLSQSELAGLLASREGYMNNLFAGAIRQLEQNAALADTPSCASLQQVMAGDCLISDAQLKEVAEARLASPAADAAVASGAVPATPAAPAPTPAVPAPAAATPPAVATAALSFPAKRPVRSASLPQIQRKIAVLIGVDRYSDARIPQLDNAVADARAVGKLFEGSLGYETVVIPNANKRDVVLALNRLAVEVSPRDSVVIYYAGHGALVPATGLGYWQLADSNPDQPQTWMSNSDINKSIAQFGATQVALISDSCYSGSLVDQKLRGAPAETDVGKLLERKAVVVMSSGGNEPVFDSGKNGHSSFAWNLMSTLEKVSTWQAGGNVFERVRFAVARELPQRPQYGTSAAAGHQAGGDYLFEQRQLGGAAN